METLLKREAWNKNKLVRQKPPVKLKAFWLSIPISRMPMPFVNSYLRIDSKPRGGN